MIYVLFFLSLILSERSFAEIKAKVLKSGVSHSVVSIQIPQNIADNYFYADAEHLHLVISKRSNRQVVYKVYPQGKLKHDEPNIKLKYFDKDWKTKNVKLDRRLFNKKENLAMGSAFKRNKNMVVNDNAEILVEVDKQQVSFGEGVIVKYSLLSKNRFLNYRISQFPSYSGFIKRFFDPGNSTRPINFEGRRMFATPLYHVELFPLEGKNKSIDSMKIIVNENSMLEYRIESVDLGLKYRNNPSIDPFSNLKIEIPDNVFNDGNNKTDFEVILSGRGMLEKLNDLKFSGEIIKESQVILVDQKYKPGFGKKTYKVVIEYENNKSGIVYLYYGGKIRKKFNVDSFNSTLTRDGKAVTEFTRKLIIKPFFNVNSLNLILLCCLSVLILFPRLLINTVKICAFTFRLWLLGSIPAQNYRFFIKSFFRFDSYGLYFNSLLLDQKNLPSDVLITIKKINWLLKSYGVDKYQIKKISISFFELLRLSFYLNKEGLWKF